MDYEVVVYDDAWNEQGRFNVTFYTLTDADMYEVRSGLPTGWTCEFIAK